MSGHFATLLAGRFGIDEYTEHIIDFLAAIGANANVIPVCKPCVAALAVALMSEDHTWPHRRARR